jgi:hypothetical protein
MKRKIESALIVLLVVLCAGAAFAAETKIQPKAEELKRMSTFLSNFTEQGFLNFDIEASGSDELLHMTEAGSESDLIRFGIMHNFINNYKSRISQCKTKNCEYGSLVIDGKYVVESVKKYFDLDLKNQSVTESDPPYFYDGKLYHFEGAAGEANYYANVKEVFKVDDKTLRMTGTVYDNEAMFNAKSKKPDDFTVGTFKATAKLYKFGGKDTWAILSLVTAWDMY